METPVTSRRIPVRNAQQARDWRLALLSQGIESAVVRDEPTDTWALEVDGPRLAPALQVLKLYHVENRGWGLRRELPVVHLDFNWTCLVWTLFMGLLHYMATLPGSRLTSAGLLTQSVRDGEFWRLLTAMTLHQDIAHVTSNLVTGSLLLGLCMARHGTGLGLLGPALAGAAANLAALFIYAADYRSLGASGMVLATLGVLTATGAWEAVHRQPGWKPLFATLSAGLMLFVLTGSNPASDLVVHLGGFVFGLVSGALMEALAGPIKSRPAIQGAAMALVGGGIVTAWFWALAR